MPTFLLISIEFCDPVFSGNGVLARMYTQGLADSHFSSPTRLDVLCARPVSSSSSSNNVAEDTVTIGRLADAVYAAVPVPQDKWRKLDRNCPHAEFAAGAKRFAASSNSNSLRDAFDAARQQEEQQSDSEYDCIFFVDWHGFLALDAVTATNKKQQQKTVWLNFRVFCNKFLGDASCAEYLWYRALEVRAMKASSERIAVLSKCDADLLRENYANESTSTFDREIAVLEPPLQPSFTAICSDCIVQPAATGSPQTFFITCCVRLDPTKNAAKFVDIVECLAAKFNNNRDDDSKNSNFSLVRSAKCPNARVIPFLCGAAADPEYAERVKEKLRRVCCGDSDACNSNNVVIRDDFVTSVELVRYFRSAVLNFHPTMYDAYGMTVPEAAAAGVLSVVHGCCDGDGDGGGDGGGCEISLQQQAQSQPRRHRRWTSPVGACDFMRHDKNEVVLLDFRRPAAEIADALTPLLVGLLERSVAASSSPPPSSSATTAETTKKNDGDDFVQFLNGCVAGARERALSYTPAEATRRLLEIVDL